MRRLAALARALSLSPALRPTPAQAPAAARAFAWRTRSDAPPPRLARPGDFLSGVAHSTQWRVGHRYKVLVEFDQRAVDLFITLADALEEALPDVQVEGNAAGVHPRPGAFEVTTEDGRPVFSRLDARYYPARTELVDRVRRALPRKTAGVGGVA